MFVAGTRMEPNWLEISLVELYKFIYFTNQETGRGTLHGEFQPGYVGWA